MTNATKTLGLILTALILLLAFVIRTDESGQSEIFRETLVQADTALVDRVVIRNFTDSSRVELNKENGNWTVAASGNSYEADNEQIDRALNELTDLEVIYLVTRQSDQYSRYQVDSTGTFVSLYDGDELLEGMIVGMQQIVDRQDYNNYIRMVDEDEVFAVDQYLRPVFTTDTDHWRDKTVWRLDKNSITQVDVEFAADSAFTMTKQNSSWLADGDTLDTGKTDRLLQRIADLSATGFSEGTGAVENPEYTVRIQLDDGQTRTLSLRSIENDNSSLEVSASDYPYRFTVNRSSWERIVLLGRQALLIDDLE